MNLDFAKVCGKHNAIYEAYYKQIDPKGSGAIEAMVAAKFLKKSGLSDVVLSRVWDLSDPNGKGFLDKPGFFVALKLVSLAQAGQVVNMSNIYMETANPPKVGDLPKIMPPRIQTVPVSSGGVANGDWSIGVIDRLKYEQLFESQKPIGGKLNGNKVKGLLMESKLPMDTLGKIWDLADQDKDGNLDKHEFIVAMHLVYQTLEKRTVPDVLPPELRKPGVAGPPPKPVPPVIPGAPMPRAPSSDGFGDGGFVANFPKDIAPPPIVPPPLTRVPPVGASVAQPLISTDPLIPIGAPIASNVEWVVTPSELIRYEVMFRDSDRDKDGLVSGLEVKNVFLQSGVAQQCLAHIWALCDTNQSGKLTLEQFALAMWMVERKQKGIEPPQVLTANMVPPSMRAVITGVDLQSQEPKPTYSNPELEMISKEIEELAKERRALETEIAQKEADIRIKSGEVRSLQSELDTLSATLKQLENQRGEAQKRLDDLKSQVNKIREQCQKQEDTINEQEGELNAKRSELQKLKDEETALQKEYDDNNRELTNLTQHLQNTQLQISSIRSMVTQLMETQRQMTDALLLCRAAIENQDGELVSEYQLKIEPDFDDARKTLERKFEEVKTDPFEDSNSRAQPTAAISNGFGTDPFNASTSKSGFDDSFSTTFSSGGFDGFASGFGQTERTDPFASNAFASKPQAVTPDPGKDDFGSDPFAALHAPTGQGQVLSPNTQKSGPPPRPESPSPALPPKKSKVPPPRPAPPRPVQGPARTTPQSTTDAFGSSSGSGGFADFADFDNKLVHIPPPLPPPLSLSASSNTSSGSTTPSNKMLANLAPPPTSATARPTPTIATKSNLLEGYSLFSEFTPSTVTTTTSSKSNSADNKLVTLHTPSHITTTTTTTITPTNTTMQSNSLSQQNDANPTSTTTTSIAHDDNLKTTTITSTSSTTTTTQAITTARKTPQLRGPTDFNADPFKDYRYEDPFTLKDPFADDDDIDVFSDPNKVFKDDLSSDDEDKSKAKSETPILAVRQTPIGSDFLNKFDAFTLSASPVSDAGKSKSNTPVADFDNFANFDAFSSTVASNANSLNNNAPNSGTNNKSDNFFEVFNDNFELNDKNNGNLNKNSNNFNNNLFDAFGKTTPTTTLEINQNYNSKKNNKKQAFDAFDAFAVTTTTTKSEKLFEDDFNDNSFGDNFFNQDTNKNNKNLTAKINTNDNFDEFDGGSSSFVADFNTTLNNSKNLNGSNKSSSTKAMLSTTKTTTLTKVQNDFSQPDTFEADLEEALRRSLVEQ